MQNILPILRMNDANTIFARMNFTFYLKKEYDRVGRSPIYLNVTIGGQRKRISTGIKIFEKYWDSKKGVVIDSEESHDSYLEFKKIEGKITNIRVRYRLSEQPLTMAKFIEHFKTAPATFDFIQFYESIKQMQDLSPSTIVKHDGIFAKLKKCWPSLLFADISYKWFDEVRHKFRHEFKNTAPTINSNISVIKKYIAIAESYGIKIDVDLNKIAVGHTGGRIIWLTSEEIEKLHEYYFSSFIPSHLKLTLGYFLVSCYTGLRIGDIKRRNREEMMEKYVRFVSWKSKKSQMISIIPKVHDLIENNPDLFIVWKSEVNLNSQLKEIAKICGIKKRLFFHVGRHTYATNYILRGGNVKMLQQILGHSKLTTTMKYMHITETEAADSMMIMQ